MLGHPEIDRQHQTLCRIAREVSQLASGRGRDARDFWDPKGEARAELMDLIEDLEEYARKHFSYEEALMDKLLVALPPAANHIRMHLASHEELRGHLAYYKIDVKNGKLSAFSIAAFTNVWVVNHINRVDLAFVAWLKEMDGRRRQL